MRLTSGNDLRAVLFLCLEDDLPFLKLIKEAYRRTRPTFDHKRCICLLVKHLPAKTALLTLPIAAEADLDIICVGSVL